ncbi:MAG: NAD(P)-dependent glycerol-3-phosphate dehydrogenase [Fimbriimonadaceae bacterium]|nr:NAD(P)-dependent glycerol-3-phosphate dehydrogenase [Fimbriimonadaceae bacterium]
MTVTVLGAGSWGTALAILLARNGHEVTLFGRESEEMLVMSSVRENLRYLPGFAIPTDVRITSDPTDLKPSDLWVMAVPSHGVRAAMSLVQGENPVVTIASKGMDTHGPQLLHDVVTEVRPDVQVSVISGPNLAIEIVRGIPTGAVVAAKDLQMAEKVACAFNCRTYRVYITDDVAGVELAGSLKNVLAIGAGISDGLGFGDNTKGALLARGLGEIAKIGLAMGGRIETFMGIAGVGDLFATASSNLSRNYRVGHLIGEGDNLHDALEKVGQVAEGVTTAEAILVLARQRMVRLPVIEAIDTVLRGRMKPLEAVGLLMEQMPKRELQLTED